MYTFKPKEKFAKASGSNVSISTKTSAKIFRVIRGKKLSQVKRLLDDLQTGKRSLEGKYHTKTVRKIKELLESCEKNAEFLGLNANALFVHASAHQGNTIRRKRRRAAFGSRMKATNLEIMLIERGKIAERKEEKKEKKKEVSQKKEEVSEKRKEKQLPKKAKEETPPAMEEKAKSSETVKKENASTIIEG